MISRPTAGASPGRRGDGSDYPRPGDDGAHVDALCDALTGLANRAGWDDVITRADAARAESPMTASVIVLDVDRVELANESRGNDFGDELLRTVASVVVGVLREQDLVARIGGDEFAVLLPGVDETICSKVVTRLHEAFARSESLDGFPLTVALGCAVAENAETLTRAERWADARMFVDKTEPGRMELLQANRPATPSNVVALRR
jgi:diguanylate cyclase (GGDEF)-like protein